MGKQSAILFLCSLAGGAAATGGLVLLHPGPPRRAVAAEEPAQAARPSDGDAGDLGQRVIRRMQIRLESEQEGNTDGLALDPDEHDPTLWIRTAFPRPADYLFRGSAYRETLGLLDELLSQQADRPVTDPLRRALLQHDLWALFDWVSDPAWSRTGARLFSNERRALYLRLGRLLVRLALSEEQIRKLPDNYAAAASSRKYPAAFDAEKRQQAFLPPDLWDPRGPWVLLGEWGDNPLASRHIQLLQGRSTFVTFLRLPQGRAQTLDYLQQLRDYKGKGEPPQLPPGAQAALVRRMMLINDRGAFTPTPLTEALQLRVFLQPTKSDAASQVFLELRLHRRALLAGRAGGLAAMGKDDRDREDLLGLAVTPLPEKRIPILASCPTCHDGPGILSVNSFTGRFDFKGRRTLTDALLKDQENATIAWKEAQFSWGLLTGLRETR